MFLGLLMCLSLNEAPALVEWKPMEYRAYVNGEAREVRAWWGRDYGGYAFDIDGVKPMFLVKRVDGERQISTLGKKHFSEDGALLRSKPVTKARSIGKAHSVEKRSIVFGYRSKTIVIADPVHLEGSVQASDLYREFPTWKALKDEYSPDDALLDRLRAHSEPVELDVYFGTWCGDSHRETPRVLKILEEAANSNITVNLVAIDRQFEEPWDDIQTGHLTNVPTIIAHRDGRELGRLTERPQGESLEADLAAILTGEFVEEPMDVGKGSVVYEGKDGSDHFQVYDRGERDGHVLASEMLSDEGRLLVRVITNKDGAPTYAELTHMKEAVRSRIRYSIREQGLRSTLRGGETGIAKHYLPFEGPVLIETPSALLNQWLIEHGSEAFKQKLKLTPTGVVPAPLVFQSSRP